MPVPGGLDVVELAGSVAAGTADKWSDLDLYVVTLTEHHDAFLADWPSWLAAITPTVFARTPIGPFIINTVTADGLTFDVAVFAGAEPEPVTRSAYMVGSLSRRGLSSEKSTCGTSPACHIYWDCSPLSFWPKPERLRPVSTGTALSAFSCGCASSGPGLRGTTSSPSGWALRISSSRAPALCTLATI
jgi:hypothetical protein